MSGLDSLLNESGKWKRGDTIKWIDARGQNRTGKYVMASSAYGYIVVNTGGKHGTPAVVAINSII